MKMKKILLLLIVSTIIVTCLTACGKIMTSEVTETSQPSEIETEDKIEKTDVSKPAEELPLIVERKWWSDGNYAGCEKYYYDDFGNRIRNEWYNTDGNLDKYWEMSDYDEYGSYRTYHYVPLKESNGKEQLEHNSYEYSDSGLVVRFESDRGYYRLYEYDEKGTEIKVSEYDNNGDLLTCTSSIPHYDSQGKLLYLERYTGDGEAYQKEEYDESGHIICAYTTYYYDFGTDNYYTEYTYDEDGKEQGMTFYSMLEDGSLEVEKYYINVYE